MATLATLRARVRTEVRDADGSNITDINIKDWLNEAQRDLADRQGIFSVSATGTTSGNTIALPATLIEIKSLHLAGEPVEFTSADIWNSWSNAGDTPLRTLGKVLGTNIVLYPTPTTGTAYTLIHTFFPTDLANDNDDVTLPPELEDKMVYYAISRAYMKWREFATADRFMTMYLTGLAGSSSGRSRVQPGPLSITFEGGPFDTADARHF